MNPLASWVHVILNNMKKETFHKKWYFRLIQAIFWCTFIFLILLGIRGILYEDDMPLVGFFWAGVLAIVYWFIKKIFYYILFGESILPRKK